jgi:phosphoglucosamine mutase
MGRLFGSSGIRGIANVDFTPELALRTGIGVASMLAGSGRVLLARDTRLTGPMFEKAFASGVMSGGVNVYRAGIMPTPALAYLTKKQGFKAGVMVTASHNPPEYNGLKVFGSDGIALSGEDEATLESRMTQPDVQGAAWDSVGTSYDTTPIGDYLDMLSSILVLKKKWRVLVDPGNGATCKVTPTVLRSLGCVVQTINGQPDGRFPGRNSEPNEENLVETGKLVSSLSADLGVAHDGDGDRIVIIGADGAIVPPDKLMAAFAAEAVRLAGGGYVVVNADASRAVEEKVKQAGGRVVRTKVGDVYIARELLRLKGIFGGEPSGAWIHPQYHLCPDGPLSAVLIIGLLDRLNIQLSELIRGVPEYPMKREKVECPNSAKLQVMANLREQLPTQLSSVNKIDDIDGVRIDLTDGSWILARPSGTEPLIRITVEAPTVKESEDLLVKSRSIVEEQVRAITR